MSAVIMAARVGSAARLAEYHRSATANVCAAAGSADGVGGSQLTEADRAMMQQVIDLILRLQDDSVTHRLN